MVERKRALTGLRIRTKVTGCLLFEHPKLLVSDSRVVWLCSMAPVCRVAQSCPLPPSFQIVSITIYKSFVFKSRFQCWSFASIQLCYKVCEKRNHWISVFTCETKCLASFEILMEVSELNSVVWFVVLSAYKQF